MTQKSQTTIRLGTRGSALALRQTEIVRQALLKQWPEINLSVVKIRTTGDKNPDRPLSGFKDAGAFTSEIEQALAENRIDAAVHSLKDLPSTLDSVFRFGAILKRTHSGDVFISKDDRKLQELPSGSIVATGSCRRRALLLHYRSDLKTTGLRGNIDTRLKKLQENDWAGIILAEAGLVRLGLENRMTERLPIDMMLPAPGQGAIAVEIRANDSRLCECLAPIDDEATRFCVEAERAFIRRLEVGCQVPVAAYAQLQGTQIQLEGLVASLDGTQLCRAEHSGQPEEATLVGKQLAEKLIEKGAAQILNSISSIQAEE